VEVEVLDVLLGMALFEWRLMVLVSRRVVRAVLLRSVCSSGGFKDFCLDGDLRCEGSG
jgi:hypothetical protein